MVRLRACCVSRVYAVSFMKSRDLDKWSNGAQQASTQARRASVLKALVPTVRRARLHAREVFRRVNARMNAREDTRGLQTRALLALPGSTRQDLGAVCVRYARLTLTVVRARQSASATLVTP